MTAKHKPTAESSTSDLQGIYLAALAETSQLLDGGGDPVELLHRIAVRAREITSANFAAISTFDEAGRMERFIYDGMPAEIARRLGSPPVGRGLLGALATYVRPLRLDDLRKHPRFTGWPDGHPDMEAFLGVPIRAANRTIGSLYMTRERGAPPFSDTDEFAGAVLALQIAVSVQSALAREGRARVSLLEERVRIAHDLHDGTIQSLYAFGLELEAQMPRPSVDPELRDILRAAVRRINGLIAEMRQYIAMLEADEPHHAPDLGRDLAYVVRQLVPAGVATVLNITAPAQQYFNARDAEDLMFIAREAISNSIRHASPTRIALDLRQTGDEIAFTIQDNGVGFDPENTRKGLGTTTMQTRAERLGAKLTILSVPGMGTTVRLAFDAE